jgi:hypothetical protein
MDLRSWLNSLMWKSASPLDPELVYPAAAAAAAVEAGVSARTRGHRELLYQSQQEIGGAAGSKAQATTAFAAIRKAQSAAADGMDKADTTAGRKRSAAEAVAPVTGKRLVGTLLTSKQRDKDVLTGVASRGAAAPATTVQESTVKEKRQPFSRPEVIVISDYSDGDVGGHQEGGHHNSRRGTKVDEPATKRVKRAGLQQPVSGANKVQKKLGVGQEETKVVQRVVGNRSAVSEKNLITAEDRTRAGKMMNEEVNVGNEARRDTASARKTALVQPPTATLGAAEKRRQAGPSNRVGAPSHLLPAAAGSSRRSRLKVAAGPAGTSEGEKLQVAAVNSQKVTSSGVKGVLANLHVGTRQQATNAASIPAAGAVRVGVLVGASKRKSGAVRRAAEEQAAEGHAAEVLAGLLEQKGNMRVTRGSAKLAEEEAIESLAALGTARVGTRSSVAVLLE